VLDGGLGVPRATEDRAIPSDTGMTLPQRQATRIPSGQPFSQGPRGLSRPRRGLAMNQSVAARCPPTSRGDRDARNGLLRPITSPPGNQNRSRSAGQLPSTRALNNPGKAMRTAPVIPAGAVGRRRGRLADRVERRFLGRYARLGRIRQRFRPTGLTRMPRRSLDVAASSPPVTSGRPRASRRSPGK
jgi:hypothetical protein